MPASASETVVAAAAAASKAASPTPAPAPAPTPSASAAASSSSFAAPAPRAAAPALLPAGAGAADGPAVQLPDAELVALLRQKPKHVPQLHNRAAFRAFFLGMPRSRMLRLLAAAGAEKRLELLDGGGVLRED